jgi:hypothetical protein
VASLRLNLPENNSFVTVTRRSSPDLPVHVRGSAFWYQPRNSTPGYYCLIENNQEAVEFINDQWYGLLYDRGRFLTRRSNAIVRENSYGLGWWSELDPQNPDHSSSPESIHTPHDSPDSNEPSSSNPAPLVTALAEALAPVVSLQGTLPLDSTPAAPVIVPAIIASVTTQPPPITAPAPIIAPTAVPPMAAPAPAPPTQTTHTGGLRGVPPNVFTGDRSRSEAFLNEFRRYRLLNKNNDIISNPSYRVLTALSYIKGPLVEDWVNERDKTLEKRTNRTLPNSVPDTDEILWTEFETAFKAAWKDGARTQSAYDLLMKLTMKDLDVDTYIATFERLASAAEWEPDAKGTIARFRKGLQDNIHRRVLNRETIPSTMVGWKEAARAEVNRTREIMSAGLSGFRGNQRPRDFGPFQTNQTPRTNPPRTSGIVPMDVDTTTTTFPFNKLTDEERVQYRAEGRCFRCRQKGHMARNCPNNANRVPITRTIETTNNTNATPPTTTPSSIPMTATPAATPGPILTIAQQIRALEERMTEEERGAYLDARDMGSDFYSVES